MCNFPNITYEPDFLPLGGEQVQLPKSPRSMCTTLINRGIIPPNFLEGITNMQRLEQTIFDSISDYPNNGISLERIFHLIEIWGGSAGRFFYTNNGPFLWADIEPIYKELVNTCLTINDNSFNNRQIVFEACNQFQSNLRNAGYKYMGVAYITKHTRFWLHRNLGADTLPIYDSTFSINVTQEGRNASFNYLLDYWNCMIQQANLHNVSLLALERQLFNYFQNQ